MIEELLTAAVALTVLVVVLNLHQRQRMHAIEAALTESRNQLRLLTGFVQMWVEHWGEPADRVRPQLQALLQIDDRPSSDAVSDETSTYVGFGLAIPVVGLIRWVRGRARA